MPFFDLPSDDELTPEVRQMAEEYCRMWGAADMPPRWRTYARNPGLFEARFKAFKNLNNLESVSWEARMVALMLMAHAKRCESCFAVSRSQLDRLGYDDATLDGMCANPDALPLKERDRHFVYNALKIATSAADLNPKDFKEMAQQGFSREEVQQMIGFVAYWVMNMIFAQAAVAGLAEE